MKIKLILAACTLALSATAWADDAGEFIQAVMRDHASRIMSLLLQGADPNVRDARGAPSLYLALQQESLNAAQAILASPRLDPNLTTPADETPLMMAAFKGQTEMARALLAKGASVNKSGWSPLHYAATGGHTALIRLLLDRGADIEARSPNGSTPLMMAARYGSAEAVQMLLRAGADPRARNVLGMDARDFAVSNQRPDIAELLTEARRRTPVRAAAQPENAPSAAPTTAPDTADTAGASAVVVTPVISPAVAEPAASPATDPMPEPTPPAAAPPAALTHGTILRLRGVNADRLPLPGQAEQITPAGPNPAAPPSRIEPQPPEAARERPIATPPPPPAPSSARGWRPVPPPSTNGW
jgi:hypothetical protein